MGEWKHINWRKLERRVFKLQKRIYKASLRGDVKAFRRLQKTLMNSWAAKCLSVLLANIALHGMEERINKAFSEMSQTMRETWYHKKGTRFRSPQLIRYADDFVILHKDITVVQRCKEIISEWLLDMGLELKPTKTRLTHTLNEYGSEKPGFNFLGFNIRQFKVGKYHSKQGFKTIITPSKEKQKIHYDRVASIIDNHKAAPQTALISNLNPVITGWSNYYSTVVSKVVYAAQDHRMYSKLRAWAKRRHANKSGKWSSNKYWQTIGGNNWVFATRQEGKNPTRLRLHTETPIVRYVKVKGNASPYDGNQIYWSSRMGKHPEMTMRMATLLKKQKGKCTHCEMYFREEDVLEIDHITPQSLGGKDDYKNLQILHKHCHDEKTTEDGSVVKYT
ncbi:MAG: group II intron maturase-specific domain-containing protein [Nostoc sp.]|uniref:group II intron maturase-specific domain-containing protein n=1 Tax=Nostoc sp. TaxID=1180 RepID=UPI002FFAFCB8